MSVVKTRPHFSVAIDWKKMDIEQWLEQYGSWLLIDCKYENLGAKGILGKILDSARGVPSDDRRRSLPRCRITDEEAEAVEALLAHVFESETRKAKSWMHTLVQYHVDALSEEEIAKRNNLSRFAVVRNKQLGVIRLATKHSFLTSRYID